MPADLSHDRLGRRVLDLLDDMANWGNRKYVLGEVDVFKLDHTHELYGHMNINYVRLDRAPSHDEGWKSVLDSLRNGRFFVTTGEVLIPEFSVDGKGSGSTIELPSRGGHAEVHALLRWTFPLRFAELISGDGVRVHRQRIELSDTEPFGGKGAEARGRPDREELGSTRSLGYRLQRCIHATGLAEAGGFRECRAEMTARPALSVALNHRFPRSRSAPSVSGLARLVQ